MEAMQGVNLYLQPLMFTSNNSLIHSSLADGSSMANQEGVTTVTQTSRTVTASSEAASVDSSVGDGSATEHQAPQSSGTVQAPHSSAQAPGFRRGSLQLWQFLVALLHDPVNAPCISWTGRGMEFKLVEPEEVSS